MFWSSAVDFKTSCLNLGGNVSCGIPQTVFFFQGQATSIVEDLFPPSHVITETDSPLDRLVVGLSRDLIDDYPASDPRWMKSVPASEIGLGSTMSMLVQHQIEDKMHALEFYKNFLKDVGVWERVRSLSNCAAVG